MTLKQKILLLRSIKRALDKGVISWGTYYKLTDLILKEVVYD